MKGDRSKTTTPSIRERIGAVSTNLQADPKGTTSDLWDKYIRMPINEAVDRHTIRRHGRKHLQSGDIDKALDSGETINGDIVIFCGNPFYETGGGQRYAQLAKAFSRMQYRVHLIYAAPSKETVRFHMENPCVTHILLDSIDTIFLSKRLKNPQCMIFDIPHRGFLPYLDFAKEHGIPTVYEHIDNWDTSLGDGIYEEGVFRMFLTQPDVITATSRELARQISEYSDRKIHYSPNAVDTMVFDADSTYERPSDLVAGEEKTLIYHGSLWGEWFDWELLIEVARACPDCAFNLIGDVHNREQMKASLPSNIHYPGLKKQTELPAYLQHSDIAFIPFRISEIGLYVSPLKIFEYIAMGKKVLTTELPDVSDYPNTVISNDPDVWIKTIREEITIEPYRDFVSANNWESRCRELIGLTKREYKLPPT